MLSDGSGSVTPTGGVTLALLLMAPLLVGLTVPAIVKLALPPAGKTGIKPLTTFAPETATLAGHTAPPEALEQLADIALTSVGTESVKLALLAALGPALLIIIV